jgi:hypothetical protein
MILAGGPEANVALPVEPSFPIPWVHLQDRLKLSAATIDAAFDERHGEFSDSTGMMSVRCVTADF